MVFGLVFGVLLFLVLLILLLLILLLVLLVLLVLALLVVLLILIIHGIPPNEDNMNSEVLFVSIFPKISDTMQKEYKLKPKSDLYLRFPEAGSAE